MDEVVIYSLLNGRIQIPQINNEGKTEQNQFYGFWETKSLDYNYIW